MAPSIHPSIQPPRLPISHPSPADPAPTRFASRQPLQAQLRGADAVWDTTQSPSTFPPLQGAPEALRALPPSSPPQTGAAAKGQAPAPCAWPPRQALRGQCLLLGHRAQCRPRPGSDAEGTPQTKPAPRRRIHRGYSRHEAELDPSFHSFPLLHVVSGDDALPAHLVLRLVPVGILRGQQSWHDQPVAPGDGSVPPKEPKGVPAPPLLSQAAAAVSPSTPAPLTWLWAGWDAQGTAWVLGPAKPTLVALWRSPRSLPRLLGATPHPAPTHLSPCPGAAHRIAPQLRASPLPPPPPGRHSEA